MAGPIDNQLKAAFSSAGSLAKRPTWRCSEITAMPVAPPVAKALKHMTGKIGHKTDNPAPTDDMTTLISKGFLRPLRSA